MFQFMKNWLSKDEKKMRSLEELKGDIQEETVVNRSDIEAGNNDLPKENVTTSSPKVHTELSLHPGWEAHLDAEKKYTLRFLQAELPDMAQGTVGITGFSLVPNEEGVTVTVFFRNATDHPLRFGNLGLTIYVGDQAFARQRVNLSDMEALPPYTSRPWEIFFPKETFLLNNLLFDRWKIVMDMGKRMVVWPKHLDLSPEMEARMSEEQKERLLELADRMPPLDEDQVEITGFDLGKTKDGKLVVGLLFRNARRTAYKPQKLNIRVATFEGELIASGTIDASNIMVRPGTSRPWLVVFPADRVKKSDFEQGKWLLKVTE